MGTDVKILFEATGDISELRMPDGFEIRDAKDYDKEDHPGCTHEVYTLMRYYGPWYERGDWPLICWALMNLHACARVGKIWYGGDSCHQHPEATIDYINEISAHYMKNGTRPYYDGAERK